jgi:hypothetical protein
LRNQAELAGTLRQHSLRGDSTKAGEDLAGGEVITLEWQHRNQKELSPATAAQFPYLTGSTSGKYDQKARSIR